MKSDQVIYVLEKDYKWLLEIEQGFSERDLTSLPHPLSRTVDPLLSLLLAYTSWQDFVGGKGSSVLKK